MKPHNYKSNKARKRSLANKSSGWRKQTYRGVPDFSLMRAIGDGIVKRMKKAFGSSKHRGARIKRFQARQRRR